MPKQTTLQDVLKASKGLPPATPLAAIWGRKLAGGYIVETYTGALPVTLENTVAGDLVSYKIWGNTGGVGEKKTNLAEGEQLLRNASMSSTGEIVSTSSNYAFRLIPIVEGREYSIVNIYGGETSTSSNFYAFFEELPQIGSVSYDGHRYSFKTPSRTFVAPITGFVAVSDYYPMYDEQHLNLIPLEVYEGAASPYYLPIVSSSETTNVYIGRTALGKDEYVDSESGKIYKLKEVHKDTVTINGIVWDILGYDHDEVYKGDGTLAQHTVTIQTHECVANMPRSSREALFAFPDGLEAGTYYFTIKKHAWVPSDIDKNVMFTLTKAIPSGGQLAVNQAFNTSFTTGTISSYASPSTESSLETVAMSEGNTGTSLGDVTDTVVGNTNNYIYALRGSNSYTRTSLEQFLNSDKAAGQVWVPQNVFDRRPTWYANTPGFLHNAETNFMSVLGRTKKRTALNTISDGGGYEDTMEKIFLLSKSEVYGGATNNIMEGNPYSYYEDFSKLSTAGGGSDANRVKQINDVDAMWHLRSCQYNDVYDGAQIRATGDITYQTAANAYGVAPACCIILDDIDSNTWLKEHFLIPTDPPVPLSQIPTFAGTTTISYGGTGVQPEKVELKYKKSK